MDKLAYQGGEATLRGSEWPAMRVTNSSSERRSLTTNGVIAMVKLISINQAVELLETAIDYFLDMKDSVGFDLDEPFLSRSIELHAMMDVVIQHSDVFD